MPGIIRARQDTVYIGSQISRHIAEQVREIAIKNGISLRQILEEALELWLAGKGKRRRGGRSPGGGTPATDGGETP
jgi:hypothetical protein